MIRLLFASTNQHKLAEVRSFLSPSRIPVFSLADFSIQIPDSVESYQTFSANAKAKCEYVQQSVKKMNLAILADDSGLTVPILNGAPGIHSARFASQKTDDANRKKLLLELGAYPFQKRNAQFICILCLEIQNRFYFFEGTVQGFILKEERGENGFGYDPLFYYPPFQKTFSEISLQQKEQISHRGKALKKLASFLKTF